MKKPESTETQPNAVACSALVRRPLRATCPQVSAWKKRKARAEERCLSKFRESPFTSIFWVTENQERAVTMTRLVKQGRLVRVNEDKHIFPTMEFIIPGYGGIYICETCGEAHKNDEACPHSVETNVL